MHCTLLLTGGGGGTCCLGIFPLYHLLYESLLAMQNVTSDMQL